MHMLLKSYRPVRDMIFKRLKIHTNKYDNNMCSYCMHSNSNGYCCWGYSFEACNIANFNGLLYNSKYSIVYVVKRKEDRKD